VSKLRAFISFAVEDARIRDLFIGQGKHSAPLGKLQTGLFIYLFLKNGRHKRDQELDDAMRLFNW
jgi:hypothetical protein